MTAAVDAVTPGYAATIVPRGERASWPATQDGLAASVRETWPGLAVGGSLIVSMAFGLDALNRPLAVFALLVAFALPYSGLALVALLVPLHDVELAPIAFDILLVTTFVAGQLCRVIVERTPVRISIGVILVTGYLLLSALTLVPALTRYDWNQTSSSIALFLGMAAGFAVAGAAALAFARRDARPILVVLLLSSTLAALVALAAFSIGQTVDMPIRGLISTATWDMRAFGPFFNSNYLGFFVAQSILLALGWSAASRGAGRIALLGAAVIAGIALVATFSRGSLIGAAFGIIVLAWTHSRRLALTLIGLLVVGVVLLYPLFLEARLDITFGDNSLEAMTDQSRSEQWRLDTIDAGLGLFARQPVFGVGFGSFQFLSPWFVGDSPVTYAHDWWISVIAEQGIVGSVAFAAIAVWLVIAIRRTNHPLRGTALALISGYAISSFFIDSLTSLPISIVAWLTIAAVLAPAIHSGDQRAGTPGPGHKAVRQTRDLMRRYRASGRGAARTPSPQAGNP